MQDKQNLKYKGLSRVPSDHDSFDGEMEEVYNLVNQNGELRPVVPPDVLEGTINGNLMFVHKTSKFQHLITLDGYYIRSYNLSDGEIGASKLVMTLSGGETLTKIEAVGNTLIALTSLGVKYALWKDNSYKYLGDSIPFPNIKFSLQNANIRNDRYYAALISPTYEEDFKQLRTQTGFNRRLSSGSGTFTGINIGMDYLSGRTSTPSGGGRTGSTRTSGSNDPDYQRATSGQVVSEEFQNKVKGEINTRISTIENNGLFAFPFFVRYAIRMYDGSLTKHSQPFLMLPTKFRAFDAGIDKPEGDRHMHVHFKSIKKLAYSHLALNLQDYKDIIEGVDIFISAPIYTYIYDGAINGALVNPDHVYDASSSIQSPELLFGGIYKSNEDVLKEITQVSTFYKVQTLTIGELDMSETNKVITPKNLSTIENQEPMSDDYLSHDTIIASNSFTYNEKLHLSGVSRTKFKGFKLEGFQTVYFGGHDAQIEIGEQPFIFYPGKADNVIIQKSNIINNVVKYSFETFPLSDHKGLNGSYYIDPNLMPIGVNEEEYGPKLNFFSTSLIEEEMNKLYVSESQNPFVFPAKTRITLPVGKIIAVSSNTMAISSGQFGQFPLYAFTDDGIWALEMNQEGAYIARQAVSREVAINPRIMQMDSHIGFVTAKGITILSGADTECISDIISDNNTRASKINIGPFTDALNINNLNDVYDTDDIEYFVKNCELAYEYIRGAGRIIAINVDYNYAYVFDILSKTWSKIHSDYSSVVNNFPDCYVQKGIQVANLATIGTSKAEVPVMLITRPIKLNDMLFNIRALVHRGQFKSGINTAIYGSRNGVDYVPVTSSKKFSLRAIGTPYKYFKYITFARLFPHETLSGVHLDLKQRYDNRLR